MPPHRSASDAVVAPGLVCFDALPGRVGGSFVVLQVSCYRLLCPQRPTTRTRIRGMLGGSWAYVEPTAIRHWILAVPVLNDLGAVGVEVLNQVGIAFSGCQFKPVIDGVEVAVILGTGQLTWAHQNGTEV